MANSTVASLEAELLTPEILGTVIALLLNVVEDVVSSDRVSAIIDQIQAFLPAIIKLAPELVADVKQIIADVQTSGDISDADMAAATAIKKALDTQTDADVQAALAYARS